MSTRTFVVLALLAFFIPAGLYYWYQAAGPVSVKSATIINLAPAVQAVAVQQGKNPYENFLVRHNQSDKFFELTPGNIAAYRDRVLGLMTKYKDVTPRTLAIWQQTSTRLGFTYYVHTENVGDLRKRGGLELAVGLFDPATYRQVLIGENKAVFAYMRGTGLVLVPAINCPDAILVASLYHELGHLLLDIEGLTGIRPPRQPPGSQEHIEEEVEMTELTGVIMDAAVHGALSKLIDQIIDRSGALGQAGKYSLVHQAVTEADLAQYEQFFELGTAGQIMARSALTQLRLMLEFRYIDRAYKGPGGPLFQKVERYRRELGL